MTPKIKLMMKDGVIEIHAEDCHPPDGKPTQGEPVQPPFTGERLTRLRRVYAILRDVHGCENFEQLHHLCRCNESEEVALAAFERIVHVYLKFVTTATSRQRRKDIYLVLLGLTMPDLVATEQFARSAMRAAYYRLGHDNSTQIIQAYDECLRPASREGPAAVEAERIYIVKIGHYRSKGPIFPDARR